MKRLHIFADSLFAHEMLHLLSGVLMFFLLDKMFGQIIYGVIAFLVSLLIDADHYLEGIIVNRLNFAWIFKTYPYIYWQKLGKMTLLFHSWELLILIYILGGIVGQVPLALAIVLPAILHYLIDNIIYTSFRKMPILQYFFLFRLYHRFDYKILCPGKYKTE